MRLEHVAIWTNQLEELKKFYCHYFGATSNDKYINIKKGFESYFLTFDDACRLELMKSTTIKFASEQKDIRLGFIHLAISVGNQQNVDVLTEKLRTGGFQIESEPRFTGDGYYESAVLDPDGNKVEITL